MHSRIAHKRQPVTLIDKMDVSAIKREKYSPFAY